MYRISGCIWFQPNIWPLITVRFLTVKKKTDNVTYRVLIISLILITHYIPLLRPRFEPGRTQQSRCPFQTSTVPKLLSALSNSVVDSTQIVSVSYGPYVNIQYLVNSGSGRIADSAIWPLSGSGWVVKIRIWYVPTQNSSFEMPAEF